LKKILIVKDPTGPTGPKAGSYRVLRGGSWYISARLLRSAFRNYGNPEYRGGNVGFRLVRTSKEKNEKEEN
jgi:formylglycine-generating enzyme required for sulfatase activity